MLIKKFAGSTVPETMKKIKDELGVSALILDTKIASSSNLYNLPDGNRVEITAAIDHYPRKILPVRINKQVKAPEAALKIKMVKPAEPTKIESPKIPLKTPIENHTSSIEMSKMNESMSQLKNRIDSFAQQIEEKKVLSNLSDNLKQLEAKLTDRDFDEAISKKIILKLNSQLTVEEQTNPEVIIGHLKKALNESVKISNDLPKSDNSPTKLMFIGPYGDGKTTSLQRIAYQLAVCQKKKVGLISLDTEKIGAVSALISFARILDVRCTGVYEPSELKQCLEKFNDLDVLLFDTKGINPLDKSELEELSNWISQINPDKVFLVLSANNRLRDLIEMTHKFLSTVNPEFVFTKLDQTKRYGGIISCSIQTEKPVAYLGWGRDLEDFQKADIDKIIDLLF